MHAYTNLFGLINIPSYGLMIATGVIVANIIAMIIIKKSKYDLNDFIIMEGYCLFGAFVGAKLLYLIVSFKDIQWDKIFDFNYFNNLMLAGFVFYGGLIGGLVFVFLGGKIHKINTQEYIRKFIFLIPLIHGFGRIGCHMAGCCYGRPYHGAFAIVFPENSYALPGVKLFPIQITEAILLFTIAFIMIYLGEKKNFYYTVEFYFIVYGIVRFILEFARYDEIRGIYMGLSTSQWISLVLIIIAVGMIIKKKRQK